ncbi:MAG: N-acetyltransferase [bacterium]|nr:N-acetyltransferase [bacterium]MDD5756740.1 N-acetyltransferase [bacterium]
MKLRKAKMKDVKEIQKIINTFAANGEMLPRALNELYENIRDFVVIEDKGKVVACGALHVNWEDLAEVKAFAVAKTHHRKGLGTILLKACLKEAKEMGINKIFALSYKPEFFKKYGFSEIDKMKLPHKIWSECVKCPKFPDCDEICLIYPKGAVI